MRSDAYDLKSLFCMAVTKGLCYNKGEDMKKQNIVPLKDLNLTSRFLFDEVMENPDASKCQSVFLRMVRLEFS